MSFYLRKSFSAGPIRFNLSKNGIGCSVGVRGARVGIDSQGKAYTHAGRFGIYHRQMLHSGKKQNSSTSPRSRSSVQEIEVDTGATMANRSVATDNENFLPAEPPRQIHKGSYLLFGSVTLWLVAACLSSGWLAGVGAVLFVAAIVSSMKSAASNKALKKMSKQLAEISLDTQPSLGELSPILRSSNISEEEQQYQTQKKYSELCEQIVATERVEPAHFELLQTFATAAHINEDFAVAAREHAFKIAHLLAVADHELTKAHSASAQRQRTVGLIR